MSRLIPWFYAALLCLTALPAQALIVLNYHDIRDDVAPKGDPDPYATSTQNFIAHLDWLQGHHYTPVSVQQVLDARDRGIPLPDKSILLTFDDGLRSVYTKVFPLLKAYGYPALIAPVTSWVESPKDQAIHSAVSKPDGDSFLTWDELKQMHDSGLIEIGSHTHDLHHGIPGNPQGNELPAAVTHLWDGTRYESASSYYARIHADLAASSSTLKRHLGLTPRTIVWPYGANNMEINRIAGTLGMTTSFDLDDHNLEAKLHPQDQGAEKALSRLSLGRLLMFNNPDIRDFVRELHRGRTQDPLRAIQIDMDYVYDEDPVQTERNLDVLVQRIRDIGPSHVFLQAFADPDGNGAADAVYFPNRHLPVRADLFSRVAWQLQTRAGVHVFAWLPVLGWQPPPGTLPQNAFIQSSDPADIPRLDPQNAQVQMLVRDLYEDLATHSNFEGILFHDDAYLRDDELPSLGGGDPTARTRLLIDFTQQLERAAAHWRPKLITVRNLYARPVLEPGSEAWFAQNLPAFLEAYDYTALMAMPRMEQAKHSKAWMSSLVTAVKAQPKGLDRTLFELQTIDWRTGKPVRAKELTSQVRALIADGVLHLGYYPDDFLRDVPTMETAREAFSARQFPYLER